MTTAGTILVGYDGSVDSQRAFDWAEVIAKQRNATLRIVIAGEVRHRFSNDRRKRSDEDVEFVRKEAEARLTAGVDVTGTIETIDGAPSHVLLKAAENTDMVVLGARGYGAISGALMGSVSQHLTRHAPCPVAVVRQSYDPKATAVVVGVDGSPEGEKALEFAFDFAEREERPLVAVHAWRAVTDSGGDLVAAESVTDQTLEPWKNRYPGVPLTTKTVPQPPVEALSDASQQAAVVIVGSRGRGAFTGLLLGSVGQAVLQRAQCPVVVVR